MSNIWQGFNAIKSGKCDTAIVGACNLQSLALPTMQIKDMGLLSLDGLTRCFDDSGTMNEWL